MKWLISGIMCKNITLNLMGYWMNFFQRNHLLVKKLYWWDWKNRNLYCLWLCNRIYQYKINWEEECEICKTEKVTIESVTDKLIISIVRLKSSNPKIKIDHPKYPESAKKTIILDHCFDNYLNKSLRLSNLKQPRCN